MNLRQFLGKNFCRRFGVSPFARGGPFGIGHSRGGFLVLSPSEAKLTLLPLVFIFGSLTLVVKDVFLLRKSSEGLGLTGQELAALSDPAKRKLLPPIPAQAAQILQDFGAGSLLLWPLLNFVDQMDKSWTNPPRVQVFGAGAVLFLGWLIRRLTERTSP